MEFLWEPCKIGEIEGARILRVLGEDRQAEIPEEIWEDRECTKKLPVIELGDYVFSSMMRKEPERSPDLADIPSVCGDKLESVTLPRSLIRIGRYGFYNCEKLKKLTFWSSINDLGAGLFTGCRGVEELEVLMSEGEKSCLPEILAELNQMIHIILRTGTGEIYAKLLVPEFFEESIENTPARILVLETHGCGHRYRYCFRQTQFQMMEYDALFPYVCVEEKPEITAELSWYRLQYPVQLSEASRKQYLEYINQHPASAVTAFARIQDMRLLGRIALEESMGEETLSEMAEEAAKQGQTEAVTVLMNARQAKGSKASYGKDGADKPQPVPAAKKRKFEL